MIETWKNFSKRKKFFVALLAAAVVLCVAALGAWRHLYAGVRSVGTGSVTLDIPPAATGAEIAALLEKEGLIADTRSFRLALLVTGESAGLQSGHYRLARGLTVEETIAALKKGQEDFVTVTLPEGSTARGMQEIFETAGIAGAKDFLSEASAYAPYAYMKGAEPAAVAGEGFLFADTYDIPKNFTARELCDLLYRHTDEILTAELRAKAEARKLSLHDLMTVASMVEREARFKEDQAPIAAVIYARLAAGMPLQIDATVQYALGKVKPELTLADTETPSPYNTYLRQGLPPGPIASPGRDAILAALNAEPGEFLYYVAQKDGHHVFTKTLEEHNAKIREIYGE